MDKWGTACENALKIPNMPKRKARSYCAFLTLNDCPEGKVSVFGKELSLSPAPNCVTIGVYNEYLLENSLMCLFSLLQLLPLE